MVDIPGLARGCITLSVVLVILDAVNKKTDHFRCFSNVKLGS